MASTSKNSEKLSHADSEKLHVQGLSQKEKRIVIQHAFQHLSHDLSYNEKLKRIAKRLEVTVNTVQQMGKRWSWKEWDMEKRAEASIAGTTVLLQTDKPWSTTEFLSELRQFTRRAVDASSNFTACTALMIQMYSNRLQAKVLNTPNPTEMDYQEMEHIYSRLSTYMNRAKSFMTPQAVAALLNATKFGENLPPELPADLDREAFSIHGLQRTLRELGVKSILEDAEAADKAFAPYLNEMPSIEGTR